MSNTEKIRKLNDQLRKTLSGGRIALTQGVQALGEESLTRLLARLQCYDEFSEENDPYGEHDFGMILHDGQKFFFKIDYYDLRYEMHSPDAANPHVTRRVLTLMLASEY